MPVRRGIITSSTATSGRSSRASSSARVAVGRPRNTEAGALEAKGDESEDVLIVVRAEDQRRFAHQPADGSSTTNVVPFPSTLRTAIWPPWASTIAFEM